MRGSLDSGRVPSLRWRLLILVSIASLVILVLASALSYRRARHEVQELMDDQMAKTAQLMLAQIMQGDDHLVDLPGYGFARASKTEQQGWGELMESYLGSGRVKHLFLLIDIRHAPTAEDRQMFRWLL